VVLHLGLAKTGSTALQGTLFANRERLMAQHGILYPGEAESHLHFASSFSRFPHTLIQMNRMGLYSEPAARSYLDRFLLDIERQIDQSAAHTVLLSSEYFSGMAAEDLAGLCSYLGKIADELVLFAYVRDPWSFAISLLQQHLRDGLWKGPLRPGYCRGNIEILDKFANAFGIKPVVRPYIAVNGKPIDVVDDFLRFLGIADSREFSRQAPEQANPSMGWKAACLISHVNELFPSVDASGTFIENPARDWVVEKILENTRDPPALRISRNTAQQILASARDDLARIQTEYLDGDEAFFQAYEQASFDESDDLVSIDRLERTDLTKLLLLAQYAQAQAGLHIFKQAEQDIGGRDDHIAQLIALLGERDRHIAHLLALSEENSLHIDHLNRALADLQMSPSWRITAPLRMAKQALLKLLA
jgi:hypothetical protein